jgi:hypothetical protein
MTNIVLSIKGGIVNDDEIADTHVSFQTSIPIPSEVEIGQIDDENSNIKGLTFKTGYTYHHGEKFSFYIKSVEIVAFGVSEKTKATIDVDDDADDADDDDADDDVDDDDFDNISIKSICKILPNLDWEKILTPIIDTHYNCYCKVRKVCGCGCDSLHDGW